MEGGVTIYLANPAADALKVRLQLLEGLTVGHHKRYELHPAGGILYRHLPLQLQSDSFVECSVPCPCR